MKKLGSQLTTGDVVIMWPGKPGQPAHSVKLLVVEGTEERSHAGRKVHVMDMRMIPPTHAIRLFQDDVQYGVEDRSGHVTDNDMAILLNAARMLVDLDDASEDGHVLDIDRRRKLLDTIDRLAPPSAPTYEELLAALDAAVDMPKSSRDVLERARRAGVLK
jgi:hypothetical protein